MNKEKFGKLGSGMFDSSALNSKQLRCVTGGGTTFRTAGTNSTGTDTINTDLSTKFSDGTQSAPRTDGALT